MKAWVTLMGVALVSLLCAIGCVGDRVTVSGGDGAEVGVLVDGTNASAFHNDDRGTGPAGSAITVGPFDAGPSEVIAYTVGHAPSLNTPASWTSGNDAIAFAFDPSYRVRFKIWIVQGPFVDGQTKAVNAGHRLHPSRPPEGAGLHPDRLGLQDLLAPRMTEHRGAGHRQFGAGHGPGLRQRKRSERLEL